MTTTTLRVELVAELAGYRNTFGWYNSVTGEGGILYGNVGAGKGKSAVEFTVDSADVGNIEYFLIPDGADKNRSPSGDIKVIQLANGTWAVAAVDKHGDVEIGRDGKPKILTGQGANALFTETSKNAGGVDYASSEAGKHQTETTLSGDTADGPTGTIAWEDLAATRNKNGTYSKPGDADYNDAVFKISVVNKPPQARPDKIAVSEDAGPTTLDVLANDSDPESGALSLIAVKANGSHGGSIGISADGKYLIYTPSADLQKLSDGEKKTEAFTYTVADQWGATSTASVNVTIVGVNDAAILSSATANLTEANTAEALKASGKLTISDIDSPEKFVAQKDVAGDYGTFSINKKGEWSYSANSAHDAFADGVIYTDKFVVTSVDGTETSVTVNILGTNDPAVVSADTRHLVEGNSAADISTSGKLSISDVDNSETFVPQTDTMGAYGKFSIGADGAWSYAATSAHDEFVAGQHYVDVFDVFSSDGTPTTVTIDILGAGEATPITAGKYYLLIDGVDGGSTAKGHEGWFEIDGFTLDVANLVSDGSGGGDRGKAVFSPLVVDLAFPTTLASLMAHTAGGEFLRGVKIEGVTNGERPQTFYELTLADVLITKTQESHGAADRLVFDYGKLFLETMNQKSDGSFEPAASFAYDLLGNTTDAGSPPNISAGDSDAGLLLPAKYFLLIDGVNGGSTAEGHEGWFEIDAFSLSVENTAAIGSGSQGRAVFSPLTVDLAFPSTLAALMSTTAEGHHLRGVKIEGVSAGERPETVYELTLADVLITNTHETNGAADQITFDYRKVFFDTMVQQGDGSVVPGDSFAFDVIGNTSNAGTPPNLSTGNTDAGLLLPAKYFLLIDGMDGGSTAIGHEGWFEIDGFEFAVSNLGSIASGGVGGIGRAAFTPLTVDLAFPTALASLLETTARGEQLRGIKIEGVTAGEQQETLYELTLADVQITKTHETNGAADQIVFGYGKIFLDTMVQQGDGSVVPGDSFAYDVFGNTTSAGSPPNISAGNTDAGLLLPAKYFLLIDGMNGGSTAVGHEGWFEIDGFTLDVAHPGSGGSGGGGGIGKASFSPLTVDLAFPTALASLMETVVAGHELRGVKIEGVSAGEQPETFYELTLADVLVTRTHESSGAADQLTFDYGRIFLDTMVQQGDGSVVPGDSFAYDVLGNTTSAGSPPNISVGNTDTGLLLPAKYFLLIDGMNGGSTAAGHEGWFEIDGFGLDVSNPASIGAGGGGAVGKAVFAPLTVDLAFPTSLASLLDAAANGEHLRGIKIEGVSGGEQPKTFYELTLADVLVTKAHEASGSADQLVFDYGRIFLDTMVQQGDGSVVPGDSFAYDILGNTSNAGSPPNLSPSATDAGLLLPAKYFLQIEGIDGGSIAKGHEGWFEIDAFHFALENSGSVGSGAGTAGKTALSPLEIDLAFPTTLPLLLDATATGEHIETVRIEGVSGGERPQTIYELTLSDVLLTHTRETESAADALILDYEALELTTLNQEPDGSFSTGFNFIWNPIGLL